MAETVAYKYRAFISYSHADTGWARWLHRGLEGFRIDKDLVGRETAPGIIPKSLRPVFRDRDDFTAGHSLTDQTLAALDAAAALIVICSLASAKSHYVTEEIRLFKSRHPERPVIPLIVDGKPGDPELECFPPSLEFKLDADGKVTNEPVELLAADAREEGDGKNLALAKVVAGLLGVSSDDVFRRAERERRRKGRVRNSVIAGLAVLGVAASGSAVYAWHQLKTNEAFLSATLKTATGIVNEAVAQAEKYGVPRQATLGLLTKAEGLFDNMALLGRPTPELRYQKAWMLIQFARNYAILGDSTKQKQRAEQAHRIMAELTAELPDDPDKLHTLAATLDEKGKVLATQGKLAEALQAYQGSLAIVERLAKVDPSNTEWQRDLSLSQSRVGNIFEAQGKFAEALKSYQDDLAIAERLAKADPANAGWQRDLSVSYNRVGDVLETQGKLAEALKAYRDSLAIAERLAKADPSNTEWQRDFSVSNNRVGNVLKAQGKLAEALKTYQDSLAIAERLAKADPSNTRWQRDLSVAFKNVGDVLKAQGKFAEALKAYQDSLAITDRLAKADPSNTQWQYDLAGSHYKVATIVAQQGDVSGALNEFRAAQAIITRLKELSPDKAQLVNDLSLLNIEIAKLEQAQAAEPGPEQPQDAAAQ